MKLVLLAVITLTLFMPLAGVSDIDILSSKDLVGYIYNGDVSLLDLNSGQEVPCIGSGVWDFCWDYSGNRIYYLRYNPDTTGLEVGCVPFPTGAGEIIWQKQIPPLVGLDVEGGELLDAKLILTPDWGLLVQLGFGNCYVTDYLYYAINLENRQVHLLNSQHDYPWAYAYRYPPYFSTIEDRGRTITLRAEQYNDLYLLKGSGGTLDRKGSFTRLSNTQNIDREQIFTDGEFYYSWAPDSSCVVFGFETYSGDLLHGVTLAVNKDGFRQQILDECRMLGNDFEFGWTSNNRLVYSAQEYLAGISKEEKNSSSTSMSIKLRDQEGNISTIKQFPPDSMIRLKYRHSESDLEGTERHPRFLKGSMPWVKVLFDDMRLREEPGLKGKVLTTVSSTAEVEDLGESSTRTDTVILRGTTYHSRWYKVRSFDGITGWIYGAAIGR